MHRSEFSERKDCMQREVVVRYTNERGQSCETRVALVNLATFILTHVQHAEAERRCAKVQHERWSLPYV